MAEQWRIFVVEDEQNLNRNIVSTLRKDGYFVQGVTSGADAVRALWSEDYDVVICDLKAGGSQAFELLEWLRIYRPNTRVIMVGFSSEAARTQALESGASSYLDKPLDLHVLKEELRRLLQQTGFSADLDSFDLLDVIQIIHMSRKSIALLVNTGVEERGILRFQEGDLIWAEYGLLRGEEAFFALAAHKNGTVLHQPWNERIAPNVKQPLSRLILQALHYRTKYAHGQGEAQEGVTPDVLPTAVEYDDTPFAVLQEDAGAQSLQTFIDPLQLNGQQGREVPETNGLHSADVGEPVRQKEWWEQTGRIPLVQSQVQTEQNHVMTPFDAAITSSPTMAMDLNELANVHKTPVSQRVELPSWLTDQPTSGIPAVRPSSLSNSAQLPAATPILMPPTPAPPTNAEWSPAQPPSRRAQQGPVTSDVQPLSSDTGMRRAASAEWGSLPEQMSHPRLRSIPLQSLASPVVPQIAQASPAAPPVPPLQLSPELRTQPGIEGVRPRAAEYTQRNSGPLAGASGPQRVVKKSYNYTALATALQTLGYSINGFIAAAVVSIEGQPIAQVTIDELDISALCRSFSSILKSVLQALDEGQAGAHDHTVITSSERHILMRVAGLERNAFQVLITTREADPVECLEVMANIEGAISAALR